MSPGQDRGRSAASPNEIPVLGWKDILLRVWNGLTEHRVVLIAGGASFFLLLSLFPAISAFVSIYGLFFNPRTAVEQVTALDPVLPEGASRIIRERLHQLTSQSKGALTLRLVAGALFAFWGANKGVKAIFDAINVAYGEKEKRSFLYLNVIASLFTIGAIVTSLVLISTVNIVPVLIGSFDLAWSLEIGLSASRWIALVALLSVGLSLLYRYGPSRRPARWLWITWGGGLAATVWVAASAGFSFYLRNFAGLDAIYGSLGAIVALLVWIWISVFIVIVGAMINAEMEHQTRRDTTVGVPRPEGQRGAIVADSSGPPT